MHLRRAFPVVCILIALGALGLSLICLINPHEYYLYLLDIFSLPLFAVMLGLMFAFVVVRQKPALRITLVALVVLGAAVWPQAFTTQRPADMSKPPVRLMFANIFIHNPTPKKIIPWITKENPDIIAVVERNPETATLLSATLKTSHPYQYSTPNNSEIAIYSRYRIFQVPRFHLYGDYITVRIATPNGPLTVIVTHLSHPGHRNNWLQNFQLSRLYEAISSPECQACVIVGDFNTDMSGYLLADFARKFNLRPLANRVGTWPSILPGALRIGIDNAFAGKGINLSNRKVGPYNGSDHRPLLIDIRPAKTV